MTFKLNMAEKGRTLTAYKGSRVQLKKERIDRPSIPRGTAANADCRRRESLARNDVA